MGKRLRGTNGASPTRESRDRRRESGARPLSHNVNHTPFARQLLACYGTSEKAEHLTEKYQVAMQLSLMGWVLSDMPRLKVRDGPTEIHHKMKVEMWQRGSAELRSSTVGKQAVPLSMPPAVLTLVAQSQLVPLTPCKAERRENGVWFTMWM